MSEHYTLPLDAAPADVLPAVAEFYEDKGGISHATLTTPALEMLVSQLERYDNTLSVEHRKGLGHVCAMFTDMVTGELAGRYAVPISTGMGKSTLAAACSSTLAQIPGARTKGITICGIQVEALCQVVRDCISMGCDASRIGIWHSYTGCDKALLDENGELKPDAILGDREATIASVANEAEALKCQVLLITHNKVASNVNTISRVLTQYEVDGEIYERSCCFWDEGLERNRETTVKLGNMRAARGGLKDKYQHDRDLPVWQLINFVNSTITTCEAELENLRANRKGRTISLPFLSEGEKYRLFQLTKQYKGDLSASALEALRTLIDLANEPVRVTSGGTIRYQMRVPRELKNVIVLDASYPIRELCLLDTSVVQADNRKKGVPRMRDMKLRLAELKSFENVNVFHMVAGGGRSTVNKKLNPEHIARDVVNVIKRYEADKAVLIWVYKENTQAARGRPGRKARTIEQRIRVKLKQANIDPDATITVSIGREQKVRRRIVFATWGNETNLNTWSYCDVVIMAGILQLDRHTLTGKYLGAIDDIEAEIPDGLTERLILSETAHRAFQAGSRGKMRRVKDGKAEPMDMYLIHRQHELKDELKKVMPLAVWSVWNGRYKRASVERRTPEYIEHDIRQLLHYLESKRKGAKAGLKVYLPRAKKESGLHTLTPRRWRTVRDKAMEQAASWIQEGKYFYLSASPKERNLFRTQRQVERGLRP